MLHTSKQTFSKMFSHPRKNLIHVIFMELIIVTAVECWYPGAHKIQDIVIIPKERAKNVEASHCIKLSDELATRQTNQLLMLSDGTCGMSIKSVDDHVLHEIRSYPWVAWIGKRKDRILVENYLENGHVTSLFLPNRFVVQLNTKGAQKLDTTKVQLELLDRYGLSARRQYRIGNVHGVLVEGKAEAAWAVKTAISEEGSGVQSKNVIQLGILGIEPDLEANTASVCETQTTADKLWGLTRIAHRHWEFGSHQGEYAYSHGSNGSGVLLYVFDTGINTGHSDFNGRAVHGFTASSLVSSEGNDDLNGHGTHVAGTAAGFQYGVAKGAGVISVKVLSSKGIGSLSGILEAIEWAYGVLLQATRSRVVWNFSLTTTTPSPMLLAAVMEAVEAGATVVASAGNHHSDACQVSPANSQYVLTVASSDSADVFSSFSNAGRCVDLVAPGESILSAAGDSNTGTRVMTGTSMATAHVSGKAARYLSAACPGATVVPPSRVYAAIKAAAPREVLTGILDLTTPNLLLYAPCWGEERGGCGGEEDGPDGSLWAGFVVLIAVGVVLAALVLLGTCVVAMKERAAASTTTRPAKPLTLPTMKDAHVY